MADARARITVELSPEYARRLGALAEQLGESRGNVAEALLSAAIDDAWEEPLCVAELLDGIDGAFQRAEVGIGEIRVGGGIPLDDL